MGSFFKRGGSTRPITPKKGVDSGSMNSSNYKRESESRKVKPSKMVRTSMMTSDEYSKLHKEYEKELKDMSERLLENTDWQRLKFDADNAPVEEWTSPSGQSGVARYLDWIPLDIDYEYQTRIMSAPDPQMATGVLNYLLNKQIHEKLGKNYNVQKDKFSDRLQIVSADKQYGLDYS